MPLTAVCGPFEALQKDLIRKLRARGAGLGGRWAVVCPSRRMADGLQRLAVLDNGLSLLGVRFHTFYSLALEVLEDAAGPARAVVGDGLFHDKLVDRLLLARNGGRRPSRGLAAAYRASLRDLVDAGVEPSRLRQDVDAFLGEPGDRERLASLLDLQEDYVRVLGEAGILAPSGLARSAAAALEEGRSRALERYEEVLYYGFYDLTGVQADFFRAVCSAVPATVYFPYLRSHPAFRFAERFYQLQLHTGGPPPTHLPVASDGALGSIPDCLFVPGKRADLPGAGAFRLINASGAGDEAWKVAKEILALRGRKNAPVSYGDIGIVARTLEPYGSALPQVLRDNGIPFVWGGGETLLRHPIAKACLSLLTLRRRDFPAPVLLDILESPYFRKDDFRGASQGEELLRWWKRLILRLGIHSGWLQWRGKLSAWTRRDCELHPHEVEEGGAGCSVAKEDSAELWRLLEDIRRRLDPDQATGSWKASAERAKELLRAHFDVGPSDPGLRPWLKTLECLEALGSFDLVFKEPSWDEFLDAAEEKLRRASLDAVPPARGVRVLDAMDARGESFRALFLIGLNEGVFPRLVREDPLLPDSIRSALHSSGGYWIHPKLGGYEEEKMLFAFLAASARERLYCVTQRSDEEGRARVPSAYLRELVRAAGSDLGDDSGERVPRPVFEKLEALDPALLSPKEASLLASRLGGGFVESLSGPGLDGAALGACLERVEELNRRGEPGPMDGMVGRPGKYLDKLRRRGLSPSALESLSRCPFQFFASRLLGLGEDDEPSDRGELSARMRGRLYHLVLQRFYSRLGADDFLSRGAPDAWRPFLEEAIEEVFSALGWMELGLYPLLWEAAKRGIARHLRRFAAWDIQELRRSGFVPAFLERTLSGNVGGVLMRGRPDRIDLDASGRGLRVVDYKSSWPSRREPLHRQVLRLKTLQPYLYLELARKTPGLEGAEPAGAFFYVVEEPADSEEGPARAFDARTWRATRGVLEKGLGALVRQIEAGEFLIVPEEGRGEACEYCAFASLCRKSHPASRRRAERSKLREALDRIHAAADSWEDG